MQRLMPTRPGRHPFKRGSSPPGAIPIVHLETVPLRSDRNTLVIDQSAQTLENQEDAADAAACVVDAEGNILNEQGRPEHVGAKFWVTTEIADETPLFGSAILQYAVHHAKERSMDESRLVTVLDKEGGPYRAPHKIVTTPISGQQDLFTVTVYTQEPYVTVRARYVGIHPDQSEVYQDEILNTDLAMRPVDHETPLDPMTFHQRQGAAPWISRLQVAHRPIKDHRSPIAVTYQIQGQSQQGEVGLTPPSTVYVYDGERLLRDELRDYKDGELVVREDVRVFLEEHLSHDITDHDSIYRVISDCDEVEFHMRADGRGPLLATSLVNTGTLPCGNYRTIVPRTTLSPILYVRAIDQGRISIHIPNMDSYSSWHVGVNEGSFFRNSLDTSDHPIRVWYSSLNLSADESMRYTRQVIDERAYRLSESELTLNRTPLRVTLGENGMPNNLTIRVNGTPVGVNQYYADSGIVKVAAVLSAQDDLRADYQYVVRWHPYMGRKIGNGYSPLDLNPLPGHFTGVPVSYNQNMVVPSGSLILKPIKIFLRPSAAAALTGEMEHVFVIEQADGAVQLPYPALTLYGGQLSQGQYQYPSTSWEFVDPVEDRATHIRLNVPATSVGQTVVFSYTAVAEQERLIPGSGNIENVYHTLRSQETSEDILLGEVVVRPHMLPQHVKTIDARVRGGGLQEGKERRQDQGLWDEGPLDGRLYQKQGGTVLEVPRDLLLQYGGQLTQKELVDGAKMYTAFGHTVSLRVQDVVSPMVPAEDLNVRVRSRYKILLEQLQH